MPIFAILGLLVVFLMCRQECHYCQSDLVAAASAHCPFLRQTPGTPEHRKTRRNVLTKFEDFSFFHKLSEKIFFENRTKFDWVIGKIRSIYLDQPFWLSKKGGGGDDFESQPHQVWKHSIPSSPSSKMFWHPWIQNDACPPHFPKMTQKITQKLKMLLFMIWCF